MGLLTPVGQSSGLCESEAGFVMMAGGNSMALWRF